MDVDAYLQTFIVEAEELLAQMETLLLSLEQGQQDNDTLNALFRAAHTIKGSAGMFGLLPIVDFTHTIENVLDQARDGRIELSTDLLGILLSCRDHIAQLVEHTKHNTQPDAACSNRGATLVSTLAGWITEAAVPSEDLTCARAAPKAIEPNQDYWHIAAGFSPSLLSDGVDPLSLFRYLGTLGELIKISVLTDDLPSLEAFNPETLYLNFEIILDSKASLEEIEAVFSFACEGSHIIIVPPRSNTQAYIDLILSLPKSSLKLGEILVQTHAITAAELELALDWQKQQAKDDKPIDLLGHILVSAQGVAPGIISAALDKQKHNQEIRAQATETRFIRIEADRLDKLINLIGELVVSRQRVDLISNGVGNSQLSEAVTSLGYFTEQIRDAALTLRMVPIGDTFLRFKRVVRDTAKELTKEIELVIEGADTELDRSMVEKLNDPLMHIVRNAMDHGIESPAQRKAQHKPQTGVITLKAKHDGGNIVIAISDDGGGLDLERIRKKAIANHIIEEGSSLSAQELSQLIFHPGLSTAEKITSLSGRGVGMDVVKRNIEALQGTIEIDSQMGRGTTISIRLPLTLAIIDGFHVMAGDINFIIPQNTILECVDLSGLHHSKEQHCINLRGQQVPFVRLHELFNLASGADNPREKLVVVQFGDRRAGIVVDHLYGEIQTVVKPMGPIFQALKGIGGSSLLGTGAVALILDVQQLILFAGNKEHARTAVVAALSQD
ncbi:MAG: chemotaxis protein CheA [Marinagarivorans sp.]